MIYDFISVVAVTAVLRILIKDNTWFFVASFFSGVLMGFVKAYINTK